MFTGIIKGTGKIKKTSSAGDVKKVKIEAPRAWKFTEGESVSVSGICTTVTGSKKNIFDVDYIKETLGLTTAADFEEGTLVNLEKSLRAGDTLDGHMVYGHIEGVGRISKINSAKETKVFEIKVSREILEHIIYKGSVAIDGVSLTVSKKSAGGFEVSLIPYTISHTTLGKVKIGDKVNIETDIMAKYAKQHAKKK